MRNQKGITLVALVITIIVLLILAGVSISLVVGQNGVLNQASNAVITNRAAAVREKVSTALASAETTYYAQWAQNTSTTRATVYADATNGVLAQLKSNYGADNVTITGTIVGADTTITVKDGSDVYYFTVNVGENDGKATIDESIDVLTGQTSIPASKPATGLTTIKLK